MIFTLAIIAILLSMGMTLFRIFRGTTPYDRILAGNIFGSLTMLTICLLAGLHDSPIFIDMALLYALINFIATIGLLRYFAYGSLHHDE